MLPKQFHLTVAKYYANPHKSVRKQSTKLLFFVKESANVFPRFTFRLPKSMEKRSSHRHRMRRVLIEGIRSVLPNLTGEKDVLIQPIRAWKRVEEQSVVIELKTLLITCGLLKRSGETHE